ncbi:zinc-binding dehydrogenase [Streptomyces sp. TG1A-8]|uniref:quinone oxidoreductase family protein n=1 Tax=Streptomyces sp. TG1A-8 TaxID=3051385 RepID=UPI00265BFE7E|nr:zinc-binding dehydrogenase [Streptomyces sp. TG1A-8]MDO0929578.1 zinc-binding dehydrogenase [Streptomyces sp. TG1A-8]
MLITGGASSIGLIGVQIAKTTGARQVVATTRNAAKRDLLTGVGANTVVITGEQDLARAVMDATGGDGVDVVLDHVGGETFTACLAAARTDGTVINIGRLDKARSTIDLDALSYRHLHVAEVSFGFTRPAELGAVIAAAGEDPLVAVAGGRVRPLIDAVLSFDTAAQGAQRLRSHQAHGKIILTVP